MRSMHQRQRSAVEMTGPWKTWKTRRRFPTFPTAPWKSPTARFPHSHRAGDDPPSMNTENKNQDTARALLALAGKPQQEHSPKDEHLPVAPPAGYKIICPESASYGRV